MKEGGNEEEREREKRKRRIGKKEMDIMKRKGNRWNKVRGLRVV